MIYFIYASQDALDYIERSNLSTMQTLVNDALYPAQYGHNYMMYVEAVTRLLPHIIFTVQGAGIDRKERLIYIGSYDSDTGKGRNAYEVIRARDLFNG